MWWLPSLALALQSTTDPAALCALADAVAVVEVTSSETAWVEGPTGGLITRTWAAITQRVAGSVGDTAEIVSPGGTLGGVTQWVEDAPHLQIDHRYVLLLSRDGDHWRVTGGEHGAWPVPHDVEPKLPEACHVAR